MNWAVALVDISEFAGVIKIETRVGAVTVSPADPEVDPEAAVMVVVPTPAPVTRPPVEMLAIAGDDELHVTELVIVCVLLSL